MKSWWVIVDFFRENLLYFVGPPPDPSSLFISIDEFSTSLERSLTRSEVEETVLACEVASLVALTIGMDQVFMQKIFYHLSSLRQFFHVSFLIFL